MSWPLWRLYPVKVGDFTPIKGVTAIAETEKALLCAYDDDGDSFWVPKSQIHDDSEVYEKGNKGTILVSKWWAEKEGFDDL